MLTQALDSYFGSTVPPQQPWLSLLLHFRRRAGFKPDPDLAEAWEKGAEAAFPMIGNELDLADKAIDYCLRKGIPILSPATLVPFVDELRHARQ
jgi:hypothetical protein